MVNEVLYFSSQDMSIKLARLKCIFTQSGTCQSPVGLIGIVHSVMGSMRLFYCFQGRGEAANNTPNTSFLGSEGGIIQTEAYRIAGYFRGGKFSRMHDAVSFRGENFREWLTRS